MKFVKGVMIGGLITTGVVMLCAESGMINKRALTKKGRQMARKMGII